MPADLVANGDHDPPLTASDWQEAFFDMERVVTRCARCHSRKTVKERGEGHRGMASARFVITGPPNSGKTTWVNQRRKKGDIVFDFDAIATTMSGLARHEFQQDTTNALMAMRDGLIGWLEQAETKGNVFLIVTREDAAGDIARRINAEVVEMR